MSSKIGPDFLGFPRNDIAVVERGSVAGVFVLPIMIFI